MKLTTLAAEVATVLLRTVPPSPFAEQTREVPGHPNPSSSVSQIRPSWSGEAAVVAESAPEAAAVGPRGDQAVVYGGGFLVSPLCLVGFDLNLSISSDELFKLPCCLASQ